MGYNGTVHSTRAVLRAVRILCASAQTRHEKGHYVSTLDMLRILFPTLATRFVQNVSSVNWKPISSRSTTFGQPVIASCLGLWTNNTENWNYRLYLQVGHGERRHRLHSQSRSHKIEFEHEGSSQYGVARRVIIPLRLKMLLQSLVSQKAVRPNLRFKPDMSMGDASFTLSHECGSSVARAKIECISEIRAMP
jgi:hypothetical protein